MMARWEIAVTEACSLLQRACSSAVQLRLHQASFSTTAGPPAGNPPTLKQTFVERTLENRVREAREASTLESLIHSMLGLHSVPAPLMGSVLSRATQLHQQGAHASSSAASTSAGDASSSDSSTGSGSSQALSNQGGRIRRHISDPVGTILSVAERDMSALLHTYEGDALLSAASGLVSLYSMRMRETGTQAQGAAASTEPTAAEPAPMEQQQRPDAAASPSPAGAAAGTSQTMPVSQPGATTGTALDEASTNSPVAAPMPGQPVPDLHLVRRALNLLLEDFRVRSQPSNAQAGHRTPLAQDRVASLKEGLAKIGYQDAAQLQQLEALGQAR